jgi:mRNA-degrading endonuclease RelE of RelBE toxin-antitoxin system
MASYKLQWLTSAKKDLRKLPQQEVPRIIAVAEALIYRIRVGDYRIL